MSFIPRRPMLRKSALLGSAALMAGLLPSGAWAQCTDTFVTFGQNIPNPGDRAPVQELLPLGRGSSLSAFTATINTVNTAFLTGTSAFVSAPGGPQPDQQGGGVWVRGVGGNTETTTRSTGTVVNGAGVPDPGSQNCRTTIRQNYAGYQVGHDISVLNAAGTGANIHFGVTAGYLEARSRDVTPAGQYTSPGNGFLFQTPPGSFEETSQVPFVGFYGAFTKGQLALDGQVRWDFYQNTLNDALNGLANQRHDAQGFSVTANAAYTIPLRNNWFIEPSVGGIWSRVNIDPLNVAGLQQTSNPFYPYARGTVTIDDIEGLLGRASVSVGTSFTHHGVVLQPYFTASVFHEFLGDVTARSVESGGGADSQIEGLTLTSTSKGGIGTYGQFALGTAAVFGNSGWLGYSRVDYRTGEHIEGWSVNAGLRYQFTPNRRPSIKDGPARVEYSYNWTGPYIGAYVGSTWGDEQAEYSAAGPFAGQAVEPDFAGVIGGGQAGYNIQLGRTVLGIEGEYGFSNAHGGVGCPGTFPGPAPVGLFYTCEADLNRLAMLTGRVGATWGRALFYVKGGLAMGEVTNGTSLNNPGLVLAGGPGTCCIIAPPPLPQVPGTHTTNWQFGWTVGGGMEFALTDKWSARAEYMHYDLGKDTFTTFVGDTGTRVETTGNLVRVGVNLHFHPVQRELPLK